MAILGGFMSTEFEEIERVSCLLRHYRLAIVRETDLVYVVTSLE